MSLAKVLYLVRHGHYDCQDPRDPTQGKALLPVGIQQAERTGARFAQLGARIDHVYCSDFVRARQTAEILLQQLPEIPLQIDPDLREIDSFYHPQGHYSVTIPLEEAARRAHPPQALVAFEKYFEKLPASLEREVLVCHGNLIVYFLTRLLTLSRAQWEDLFIHNCSITEIQISLSGEAEIVVIGDEDHLPAELQL